MIAILFSLLLLSGITPLHAQPRVKNRDDVWMARCREARVTWPPPAVTFIAYKQEGIFEVWAGGRNGKHTLLHTYSICAISGALGPKLEQGDLQVPEGVYSVIRLNPYSSYHLSLGIDYPNKWDRLRIVNNPPGGDIFIHGDCVSAGCIALGDSAITEVYWLARRLRGTRIPVLIFPVRDDASWELLLEGGTSEPHPHRAFWSGLRDVHRAWKTNRIVPRLIAGQRGAYMVAD